MSRIIVFGLDSYSVGELHANCDRAWLINESGNTSLSLAASQILPALQFGRMVLVEHPKLPGWAGMIDTPWVAILPVQMTVYNAGYLLHLRSPEEALTLTGSTGAIVSTLISNAQADEDMYIRPGEIDFDDASRPVVFDRRDFWTQIVKLVSEAGYEMQIRPERDVDNRLVLYLDVKRRLGMDTGFLLHDGTGGNIVITDAQIQGELWNAVTGIGSQQKPLVGDAQVDAEAVALHRRRNEVVQYKNVASISVLNQLAATELANCSKPALILTVNALDVGDTFKSLRLGNTVMVRASRLYLPGGLTGWSGYARVMAMSYSETNNTVTLKLEVKL